ncbi:substrate-binding domain-containing protein [Streptomyces boninensis]|uniref:substrate-binding domain-containing protein n=1 Tax=Streptomyces boninensis TaxID=2039455 RepID=UPI003B21A89B
MGNIPWEIILAIVGVVVPVIAALWEFVVVGRKRLGYRVQMDTTATDEVHSEHAGALQQLQEPGRPPLAEPSFVLLRIENNGAVHIDTSDYAVLDDQKVGIRVRFPGRKVAGMVVTELSDDFLRPAFEDDPETGAGCGLNVRRDDGIIELPKVPMNRGAHYKVLAALDRAPGDGPAAGTPYPDPVVIGGIKGGVGNGRIQPTRSNVGTPGPAMALVGFLVMVILGQLALSLTQEDTTAAPLDCARGKLTLSGSTAFEPVLKEAAKEYADTCPGTDIDISTRGSIEGIRGLDEAGRKDRAVPGERLAFTDGAKGNGFPQLLPRPVGLSLFTLVISKDAGVLDLSRDDIRKLYAGEVDNWQDLGGADRPVRLVGRYSDSGTRKTFERKLLDGKREPDETSDDCRERAEGAPRGVLRCARGSTPEVLDMVARTPGALGYAETGAATARRDVRPVRIGGQAATLAGADHRAYPFWETEYAYTYREPPAGSLAASFLRYLTNELGRDVVRAHGHRPCSELRNPVLCRPE